MILSIDTFSSVCGVTILNNQKMVCSTQLLLPNAHSEILLNLIDQSLIQSKTGKKDLTAVSILSGPGSFTGLRIGASVAKGLCYGLEIPLLSVSTFEAWFFNWSRLANEPNKSEIGFLVDARQGDFYGSVFKNGRLSEIKCETLNNWISEFPEITYWFYESDKKPEFSGKTFISLSENLNIFNLSHSAALLAEKKLAENQTENLHTFEPLYIKDFVVKTAAKTI